MRTCSSVLVAVAIASLLGGCTRKGAVIGGIGGGMMLGGGYLIASGYQIEGGMYGGPGPHLPASIAVAVVAVGLLTTLIGISIGVQGSTPPRPRADPHQWREAARERARVLAGTAAAAARSGDCVTVQAIAPKVRALDPEVHDAEFMGDAAIAGCLRH